MCKTYSILLIFLFGTLVFHAQHTTDILIIGGGTGGTSAGIQAARMGVRVQILEAGPWLGGMLTSAGVSAIDGNHEMPSGIWGEFRQKLRNHYGGAEALATGWVSHTLFEPLVAQDILREMASLPNLEIISNASLEDLIYDGEGWKITYKKYKKTYSTKATIVIDATETGALLPMVGAEFRVGMDAKNDTGEAEAPATSNTIVQDLTYTAILEDVGEKKGRKGLVKKPKNYDPNDFSCACQREGGAMFGGVSGCEQMLGYAKLPNNKYLINWPHCGNDFYLDWPTLSPERYQEKLEEAKHFTQGFVYYIQNDLGFKNLRLAEEFPTQDGFPIIAYHREARRVKGKVFLVTDHLERPYDYNLYRTGIAVGDYPIDHHHDKNPQAPKIEFINIKVPSYTIPLGCLVPKGVENFIVAEKNISVSNIVNGTTRLQPVVLGIGQAAGALAATAIIEKKGPSEVSIRKVQQQLIQDQAYLMPFIDVKPDDHAFASIQKIGATGILKGYGVPYKWANQTWFYPERIVSEYEWKQGLLPYFKEMEDIAASGKGITLEFMRSILQNLSPKFDWSSLRSQWKSWGIDAPFEEKAPLDRRTVCILTDHILNPFSWEIDWNGNLKSN
ncbi:FAD-dependent oxidoreductase [Pareuzebyella sediminis]|uniref:FAD-dependent oxidoreductase n=1 Tax=Pareuzebyella sediminis TaxID=2607998 RepID=UPI0011EF516A|nr:FAD-dependent oxidoreductase [Pareuzebyella sediminis]